MPRLYVCNCWLQVRSVVVVGKKVFPFSVNKTVQCNSKQQFICAVFFAVCLNIAVFLFIFFRFVTVRVARWTPAKWPTWWRPTWTNTSMPAKNETPNAPRRSNSAAQSAISSRWNEAPGRRDRVFFDISTFYWMKMFFFFYRISYFARKKRKRNTQSEIVMQEPFILRRSCDFWERTVGKASGVPTLGSSESWTNAETNESLPPECRLVRPNCATWRADCIAYELCQCFF